jgi:hypothetical protein
MEIIRKGFISKMAAISWAKTQEKLDKNFNYFLEGFSYESDYIIGYYFD